MCGIAGIMAFNEVGRLFMVNLAKATSAIESRGPDHQGLFSDDYVGLGHRRLSIIDTSPLGNQPMVDVSNRFRLVFNGEIYNYQELRKELEADGVVFKSNSDTEVLLQLFIREGKECLNKLDGFFAFAIYDNQEETIFVARDRVGIKPLYYYVDDDKFVFGSELKVISSFNISKELDISSLHQYLQLSYIPSPSSVLKNVRKLPAGHFMTIRKKECSIEKYYEIKSNHCQLDYSGKKTKLKELLSQSVKRRLVSDVPLGAFLSGGIDSSVIVALASKYKENLQTFSIGFSDNQFFDETKYAEIVAKKYNTNHTTYSLSKEDLYNHLFDMLDSLDEPFADSSSLPVYILSKKVSKEVKVVLSGDGADELFAGYNKYKAEDRISHKGIKENVVAALGPLWKKLPQSRNSKITNTFRQLNRFAEGSRLDRKERYWRWCSYLDPKSAQEIISSEFPDEAFLQSEARKSELTQKINNSSLDINEILRSDVDLVLQNDMLTKVDRMSMAHGLEVRVPFLDHQLIEFAFQLDSKDKLSEGISKKILKETFIQELPNELLTRPKHGFEVPLLDWLRTDLWELLDKDLLSRNFIEEQAVFEWEKISYYKKKLHSSNSGDTHAVMWSLLVFQWWYKKNIL